MKIGEFRDLGADELKQREKDLDDQLFRLRIQKSMGQLEAAGKIEVAAPRPWRGSRRCCARRSRCKRWPPRHRSLALSSATR